MTTCNNCGDQIRRIEIDGRKWKRWASKTWGVICPERPEHVGHIPTDAYTKDAAA